MSTLQTETTLVHHLESIGEGDLDEVLSDYTDDSVLYTPDGAYHGLVQIRGFFENFAANAPPGFIDNFEMIHQEIEGEVAYIVWKSSPAVLMGTDTFVVRDGKIITQTYAAYFQI